MKSAAFNLIIHHCARRSPCGERGLKCGANRSSVRADGRSPCGERGLKSPRPRPPLRQKQSLPVRGAWIEILRRVVHHGARCKSLPVRGAWIEISGCRARQHRPCRSPCGERGLKWMAQQAMQQTGEGRSPCGERGLKSLRQNTTNRRRGRSPCGERGLKFHPLRHHHIAVLSLPVRGAWIEIPCTNWNWIPLRVAPRAGSVD